MSGYWYIKSAGSYHHRPKPITMTLPKGESMGACTIRKGRYLFPFTYILQTTLSGAWTLYIGPTKLSQGFPD